MTRTYTTNDNKTSYVIKLDRSIILSNINYDFFHEKIEKDKQLISATLNKELNTIQLHFNPQKLKLFLNDLI
jgi:hypothetical protein